MANKDNKSDRVLVTQSLTPNDVQDQLAQQKPEAKTNEEATIEHDRIETEAEKAARTDNAGVDAGQPQSYAPAGTLPSRRLSAEQEAGKAALERKHSPHAKESEKTKSHENKKNKK